MPEPRTSQDLFNKVADVIDFTPEKYNQGVWGHAGTKYIGREDPTYIEWDDVTWEHDSLDVKLSDLKEDTRIDDACGTAACVAGWACLLSGMHPTMVDIELEKEEGDGYVGSILNRVSSMFTTSGQGLFSLFSKKIGFNYNVMCDKENVDAPIYPVTGMLLQMDDIESDEGLAVGGNIFYRPDYMGRVLLDLSHDESGTLFDGDYQWEGNDLRLIGKGEDINELLESKWDNEWCSGCEESREDCVC